MKGLNVDLNEMKYLEMLYETYDPATQIKL